MTAETINEAQQEITNWLTMLRHVCRNNGGVEGYHYCGAGDFLLQHGVWYTPQPLSTSVRRNPPRQCFANSLLLGRRMGLRYVEGYAVADITTLLLPVHHAWNLDADGNLIDSTWRDPGLAYFGVEFSLGRAEQAICTDEGNVLDNIRNRFKLFEHPWQGEDFNLRWRRSGKVRRLINQLDAMGF